MWIYGALAHTEGMYVGVRVGLTSANRKAVQCSVAQVVVHALRGAILCGRNQLDLKCVGLELQRSRMSAKHPDGDHLKGG